MQHFSLIHWNGERKKREKPIKFRATALRQLGASAGPKGMSARCKVGNAQRACAQVLTQIKHIHIHTDSRTHTHTNTHSHMQTLKRQKLKLPAALESPASHS